MNTSGNDALAVSRQLSVTEQAIAQIWSDVLKVGNPGPDESFFDLGGHSLLAIRIATRIRAKFDITFPLNAFLENPTISEFAKIVDLTKNGQDKKSSENVPHRLVPIQSQGTKSPLFWIPGGRAISVLAFREVSLLLGLDQPVYGLESELPSDGAQFATVKERAKCYIDLIQESQPHGPYNLAGFCVGGMVAFEMAQQLREKGKQVALLALIQASVPGFPASGFGRWRLKNQRRMFFLRVFAQFAWMRISASITGLSREEQQQILDRVSKLLSGWIATSSELPDETQNANLRAMNTYRLRAYSGNVHLFLAEDCYESVGVSPAVDPRQGWREFITGQTTVHMVSGDHHSMLSGTHALAFADELKNCMLTSNGR